MQMGGHGPIPGLDTPWSVMRSRSAWSRVLGKGLIQTYFIDYPRVFSMFRVLLFLEGMRHPAASESVEALPMTMVIVNNNLEM